MTNDRNSAIVLRADEALHFFGDVPRACAVITE